MTPEADEHGPEVACYSGGPGEPYYQPFIKCICGWALRAPSWEDLGAAFDEHLESVEEPLG